jgi:sulfide:quinone oxidoreductase
MAAKIVVLGGSFAGLTAAIDLKRSLVERGGDRDRPPDAVRLNPVADLGGARLAHGRRRHLRPARRARAQGDPLRPRGRRAIEAGRNAVLTDHGEFAYDYPVIATGPALDWEAVPGVGPHGGYAQSICSMPHAQAAQKAWEEFLEDPGSYPLGSARREPPRGPASA